MPGQRRRARRVALGWIALGVASGAVLTGCGSSPKTTRPHAQDVGQCQSQWHDVEDSVLGLDQETTPSSLASRWNTVVATIQYYETSSSAKNCQQNIETQVQAIAALRQLNDKLRPYDMSFQIQQVQPSVDLYLHDPLPSPARNQKGKLVRPPAKAAVDQAMRTLTSDAATADADLQPGWSEMVMVDLGDATAMSKALADLDQLAHDSQEWQRCESALQVISAAIQAQEGLAGSPTPTP